MTVLDERRAAAFDRGAGIAQRQRWAGPLDVLCAIDPNTVRTPALELVSRTFAEEMSRPNGRLIITMAPQEGKSQTTSRAGVSWLLHRNPRSRIVLACYQPDLAHELSWQARADIVSNDGTDGGTDLGIRLQPGRATMKRWKTTRGGGLQAVGIGTALTGSPADELIIDDPIKGREAAESDLVRDGFRRWWKGTATSRLAPGASVCMTLTRWHYDDPAGWLLKENPDQWRLLHIPAQADPDIVWPDPLGREPGEFMRSARGRTQADWEARKHEADDEWVPLYQGAPSAPGGTFFNVAALRYWHLGRDGATIEAGPRSWDLRRDCWRFITIDTAQSTKKGADYTVASCWAIPVDGSLVLLDVARGRVSEHRQFDLARPLVERWSPETVWVESTMHGTQLVREAVQAGWPIGDLKADKSKPLRAATFASRVDTGRVWLPAEHPLLSVIVEELRTFPLGTHDDFVDTAGYAGWVAFERYVAPGVGAVAGLGPVRVDDPYAGALAEAPVDYDRAQW